MATITVPLRDVAGQIRESIRAVLHSHGFVIAQPPQVPGDFWAHLNTARFEQLLLELGNNAAMALVASAYEHEANEVERPETDGSIARVAFAAERTEHIATWIESLAAETTTIECVGMLRGIAKALRDGSWKR